MTKGYWKLFGENCDDSYLVGFINGNQICETSYHHHHHHHHHQAYYIISLNAMKLVLQKA
jgi:hypothetical protein